jgi:hypothetical protein
MFVRRDASRAHLLTQSDRYDSVGGCRELCQFGRADEPSALLVEVGFGDPTGLPAESSDIDGNALLHKLGKQLPQRRESDAADLVGDAIDDRLAAIEPQRLDGDDEFASRVPFEHAYPIRLAGFGLRRPKYEDLALPSPPRQARGEG